MTGFAVSRRAAALMLLGSLVPGCRHGLQPAPPPPTPITVLSYNIHHAEGTDGGLDPERIAAVVRRSGADLVFLQEVDRKTRRSGGVDQAAELGRLTGLHPVFGESMPYQGGGYGNAILSRWPLAGVTTVPLPGTDGREPRSLLTATVQPWVGGPPVRIAVTHLDHLPDPGDRRLQGRRLRELLESDTDTPTLLAGDFNAVPDGDPMPQLLAGWDDAAAANPLPTVPVVSPNRRIDYVLLRPRGRWKVLRTEVLGETVASDHRPVRSVLVWVPSSGPRGHRD